MKSFIRIIAIMLALTATIALVSCGKNNDDGKLPDGTTIVDDVPPSGEKPMAPGASYVYSRGKLTLASDPVMEDGKLVIYFNEMIDYKDPTECLIGVLRSFSGETIPATVDLEAHPDMKLEDGNYIGLTLVPEKEIESGTCKISVSIGTYVVETFELVID